MSPRTKVVMLSGRVNRDLVANAITQGAQGFVGNEKPLGVIVEAVDMAYQPTCADSAAFRGPGDLRHART